MMTTVWTFDVWQVNWGWLPDIFIENHIGLSMQVECALGREEILVRAERIRTRMSSSERLQWFYPGSKIGNY